MSDDELDLVETSDIVDALHRRASGGAVIVAIENKSTTATGIYYRGSELAAIGLCEAVKEHLIKDFRPFQGET